MGGQGVAADGGWKAMTDARDERLLILDFGSQTTQLIARRVREAGVYCEARPKRLI